MRSHHEQEQRGPDQIQSIGSPNALTNTQTNFYSWSNAYADADSQANRHPQTNPHAQSDSHTSADTYSHAHTYPNAYAHTYAHAHPSSTTSRRHSGHTHVPDTRGEL